MVLNNLALIGHFVNGYWNWDEFVSEPFHFVLKLNFKAALETRTWNVACVKVFLQFRWQIRAKFFSELDVTDLFSQLWSVAVLVMTELATTYTRWYHFCRYYTFAQHYVSLWPAINRWIEEKKDNPWLHEGPTFPENEIKHTLSLRNFL